MKMACVVTAYNIDHERIHDFFYLNGMFMDFDLYVICCDGDEIEPSAYSVIHVPEMPVFNIGYCSNIGIHEAIRNGATGS